MNQQFKRVGFDLQVVRLQPWKLWLLAAIGGALALALTVALAGLFLILVPLFLLGGIVARFVLGGRSPPVSRAPVRADVIEGQYEVLDRRSRRDGGEDRFLDPN